MAISRALLEAEIAQAKAAIKTHKQGIQVHRIVLEAFEKKLKTSFAVKVKEKIKKLIKK